MREPLTRDWIFTESLRTTHCAVTDETPMSSAGLGLCIDPMIPYLDRVVAQVTKSYLASNDCLCREEKHWCMIQLL